MTTQNAATQNFLNDITVLCNQHKQQVVLFYRGDDGDVLMAAVGCQKATLKWLFERICKFIQQMNRNFDCMIDDLGNWQDHKGRRLDEER